MVKIGYISACIAGDYRYSSEVAVQLDGDKVHVILSENGAVGGMDGPGGATDFRETSRVTVDAKKPGEIVKAIRSMFDSTIKRYGKPTKNFVWPAIGRGLSVELCKKALAYGATPLAP